jgi:hypothetical protein
MNLNIVWLGLLVYIEDRLHRCTVLFSSAMASKMLGSAMAKQRFGLPTPIVCSAWPTQNVCLRHFKIGFHLDQPLFP